MIETIITSALVALIVSRIMAIYYLKKIDKYTDSAINAIRCFLNDLISTLSKRT